MRATDSSDGSSSLSKSNLSKIANVFCAMRPQKLIKIWNGGDPATTAMKKKKKKRKEKRSSVENEND